MKFWPELTQNKSKPYDAGSIEDHRSMNTKESKSAKKKK